MRWFRSLFLGRFGGTEPAAVVADALLEASPDVTVLSASAEVQVLEASADVPILEGDR